MNYALKIKLIWLVFQHTRLGFWLLNSLHMSINDGLFRNNKHILEYSDNQSPDDRSTYNLKNLLFISDSR